MAEGTPRLAVGERLASRLNRRVARRSALGTSPTFFKRMGLDDPWAMPTSPVGPSQRGDSLTYLSGAAFWAHMRRLKTWRQRHDARVEHMSRSHGTMRLKAATRRWPGESKRPSFFSLGGFEPLVGSDFILPPAPVAERPPQDDFQPAPTTDGWGRREHMVPTGAVARPWLDTPWAGARVARAVAKAPSAAHTPRADRVSRTGGTPSARAPAVRPMDQVGQQLQQASTLRQPAAQALVAELGRTRSARVQHQLVRALQIIERTGAPTVEVVRILRRAGPSARHVRVLVEQTIDAAAPAAVAAARVPTASAQRARGLRPVLSASPAVAATQPKRPAPTGAPATPAARSAVSVAAARAQAPARGGALSRSPLSRPAAHSAPLSASPVARAARPHPSAVGPGPGPVDLGAAPGLGHVPPARATAQAGARLARLPLPAHQGADPGRDPFSPLALQTRLARVSRNARGAFVSTESLAQAPAAPVEAAPVAAGPEPTPVAAWGSGGTAHRPGPAYVPQAVTPVASAARVVRASSHALARAQAAHSPDSLVPSPIARASAHRTPRSRFGAAGVVRTAQGVFVPARTGTPGVQTSAPASTSAAPASTPAAPFGAPPTAAGPSPVARVDARLRAASPAALRKLARRSLLPSPTASVVHPPLPASAEAQDAGFSGAPVLHPETVVGQPSTTRVVRAGVSATPSAARVSGDRVSGVGSAARSSSERVSGVAASAQTRQGGVDGIASAARVAAAVAAVERALKTPLVTQAGRGADRPASRQELDVAVRQLGRRSKANPLSHARRYRGPVVDTVVVQAPADAPAAETAADQPQAAVGADRTAPVQGVASTTRIAGSTPSDRPLSWAGARTSHTDPTPFQGARAGRTPGTGGPNAQVFRTGGSGFSGASSWTTPEAEWQAALATRTGQNPFVGASAFATAAGAFRGASGFRTPDGTWVGAHLGRTPDGRFVGARRARQLATADVAGAALPQGFDPVAPASGPTGPTTTAVSGWGRPRTDYLDTLSRVGDERADLEMPVWARRASGEALSHRSADDVLDALAKASDPEAVVRVIVERGAALRQAATSLPTPMLKVIETIRKEAASPSGSGASAAAQADAWTGGGRAAAARSGGTRSSARVVRGFTGLRPGSGKAGRSGMSADKIHKLASRLKGLIHLAESQREGARAQVRMAEDSAAARAEGQAAPTQADAAEGRQVDIDALTREVIEETSRQLELRRERRQEDVDERDFRW